MKQISESIYVYEQFYLFSCSLFHLSSFVFVIPVTFHFFRHLLPLYTHSQLQQHIQASKQTLSLEREYTLRKKIKNTHPSTTLSFLPFSCLKWKERKRKKKWSRAVTGKLNYLTQHFLVLLGIFPRNNVTEVVVHRQRERLALCTLTLSRN